jgi:SPP1 family predicted phage head-tail adaptor
MQAGLLRQRITIQQRSTTTDVGPGKTVAWTSLAASVPASVLPSTQRPTEAILAAAERATVFYDVHLRYLSTVTPAHRIAWGTKTLQIHSVADVDGRRRELHLTCSEVA